MASNRELSERADELALQLGVEADTYGRNNRELTALVAELEEKLAAKAAELVAEEPTAPEPELPPTQSARSGAVRREAALEELPPAPAEELPAVLEETLQEATEYAGDRVGGFLPPDPEAPLQELVLVLADPPKEPEPPEPAKDPVYAIAPGRSLTSLRGILGPGTVVTAKYFLHGQATLDDLVKSGALVKS